MERAECDCFVMKYLLPLGDFNSPLRAHLPNIKLKDQQMTFTDSAQRVSRNVEQRRAFICLILKKVVDALYLIHQVIQSSNPWDNLDIYFGLLINLFYNHCPLSF